MAASHAIIKPYAHAGVASQDRIFRSGAAIVEGAPVCFQAEGGTANGKVFECTDASKGIVLNQLATTGQSPILGIALNACTAADQDVLVAFPLEGRRFVGSLTDLSVSTGADASAHALALADVGVYTILHKDTTSLKWVLAGKPATAVPFVNATGVTAPVKFLDTVTAGASLTNVVRYYPQVLILGLVDRIGAKTNDTLSFGGTGGSGSVAPPNTTFQADPATSNSGQAKVEFIFVVENTIYG